MKRVDSRTIVHVIGATLAGGAERLVAALVPELAGLGLEARLLALSNRVDAAGSAMRRALDDAHIPWNAGPTARVGLDSVLWYRRTLRDLRPAIVHLHTPNTELAHFLATCIGAPRPALFRTLHSSAIPTAWLTVMAHRHNQTLCSIACSDAVAATNRPLVTGELVTIANGVSFDFPVRDDIVSADARRALGWDPDRVHFLQVGRMNGDVIGKAPKAHDVVLAAWERGQIGAHGGMLHLVGDGELRPTLESLAPQDASVDFVGIRADVATCLLAADCFVMPSRYEGLPIAAIEALGAGLPCIFSTIPPLRALNPGTAYWVAVDSVDELAAAMRSFLRDRPAVARSDVEAIRSDYSIARTAAGYAALYRSFFPGL